jgi:hypothetical protein
LAIQQCRQAGFRKIVLRGDTDFALTEHLDRWDSEGVEFVFGFDAMPNLEARADSLETTAWKPLRRESPRKPTSRAKRPNHKEQFVEDKSY